MADIAFVALVDSGELAGGMKAPLRCAARSASAFALVAGSRSCSEGRGDGIKVIGGQRWYSGMRAAAFTDNGFGDLGLDVGNQVAGNLGFAEGELRDSPLPPMTERSGPKSRCGGTPCIDMAARASLVNKEPAAELNFISGGGAHCGTSAEQVRIRQPLRGDVLRDLVKISSDH